MNNREIKVLDKGFVKLLDKLGSDLTIINAARVSFKKRKDIFDDSDEKLIKYLAAHDHWTPFSQVQIQFHIKMPFFVARQYFRHNVGLTRNEVSRRYVKDKPEYHVPEYFRKQSSNLKQGSLNEIVANNEQLLKDFIAAQESCLKVYNKLIDFGVCAEQAREILSVGSYTEFIETGSLAAYSRICKLRLEHTAQVEIQEYARAIESIISELYPVSWKYLLNHDATK